MATNGKGLVNIKNKVRCFEPTLKRKRILKKFKQNDNTIILKSNFKSKTETEKFCPTLKSRAQQFSEREL